MTVKATATMTLIRVLDGADGKSQYTHIAYATSATGANFNHSTFANATYIGMYVDNNSTSSSTPSKYEWTLIKGADGTQGIQGPKGDNGLTPYFHTAWANNSTGTSGFSTTVSTNKTYLGTYTDYTSVDSTDPTKYSWVKIKGTDGKDGADGKDGIDGADGQSVSKVTTQYYLSTSKTSVTGGSWGTALPAWKKNTYIWTRLKIDYVNPTKTEYTTAVLDTVNNALNEVYDSGVILPSQKPQLLIKLAEIVEEYKVLNTEENKKLDEWSAYESAYNSLSSTLSVLTNDMSATSELNPSNFKTLNETYATAYNNLSKAIDIKLAQDLDTLKSRVTEAETKITDESILATVRASNEFASGAVTEQVSELAQTIDGFTASLETTQKGIDDLNKSTENIRNYINFSTDDGDDGYLELGSSKDALKLRQWRNRISFMNGEIEEAYFSNQAMHVKTVRTGRYEFTTPSETVFEAWYHEE